MHTPLKAEKLFELRLPAKPERLCLVRAIVQRAAEAAGCEQELCNKLVIALNEACMNIIQHAYKGDSSGEFVLEMMSNESELHFRLKDSADPIDLEKVKSRDLEDIRPGGLGVHFIREIMDDCEMGHLEGGRGNYLDMIKKIR